MTGGKNYPGLQRRSRVPLNAQGEPIDKHLDRISFIMDDVMRVPGTNLRFGIDPIISLLVPFAGDLIGTLVSAYVVLVSVRYGLPKIVITRMVFNIGIDYVIGTLPVIGDVFDFVWKSNDKNMALLNKYASGAGRSFWSDWAWVFFLLGGLGLLVFGFLAIVVFSLYKIGFSLI